MPLTKLVATVLSSLSTKPADGDPSPMRTGLLSPFLEEETEAQRGGWASCIVGNWLISPRGDGASRAQHPFFLAPPPEFRMGQGDIATSHQGSVTAVGTSLGARRHSKPHREGVCRHASPAGVAGVHAHLGVPMLPLSTPMLMGPRHTCMQVHTSLCRYTQLPNAIHTVPPQVHHTPPAPQPTA